MKQTAVEWLEEKIKDNTLIKPSLINGFNILLEQAKEMEKEQQGYSETEVLQLLLRLQQTESYNNLYEWFEQNKKK
jgi:hypothetical protein